MAVVVELRSPMSPAEAEAILLRAPGVRLWPGTEYPTPLDVAGTDGTHVGRVRADPGQAGALAMWVCGDNLRKGAGLNNVQIAEELLAQGLLRAAA
jgi:aspartate-semialdehyde dehydrogenase